MPELYQHYTALKEAVAEGLVSCRPHPNTHIPLYIYNYTPKCVYSRAWTPATLEARGLILDDRGLVWGVPMPKFFNYDEFVAMGGVAPNQTPYVFDKLDGFLVLVIEYQGARIVATRGSFDSPQARTAAEWLEKEARYWVPEYNRTYLFEGLFAEHRIVVSYPSDGLVYLGHNFNSTKRFVPPGSESPVWCPRVQEIHSMENYSPHTMLECRTPEEREGDDNREGYVVYYPCVPEAVRFKIKLPSYIEKHRLRFRLTPHVVWESCAAGRWHDVVEQIANLNNTEFAEAVVVYKNHLLSNINKLEHDLQEMYRLIRSMTKGFDARERAKVIQGMCTASGPDGPPTTLACHYCYARFADKDPTQMLWNALEPRRSETF